MVGACASWGSLWRLVGVNEELPSKVGDGMSEADDLAACVVAVDQRFGELGSEVVVVDLGFDELGSEVLGTILGVRDCVPESLGLVVEVGA